MRTVLVSGAGVAGLALAHWLRRNGFAPTVIERAPTSRLGGQPIDVRGSALKVVERMGLLEDVRQVRTHMRGMSLVDDDGNEVERNTEYTSTTGPLRTNDVELAREDLTRFLHERTKDGVEYVYGDTITALKESQDGVRVSFERGEPRSFDLVVGADGLRSKVRQLAFGPDSEFMRYLGSYLGVFTCSGENFLNLDNWQIWHWADEATYGIYPVRNNAEIRVTFIFASELVDENFRDVEAQKKLIAERYAHLGGHVPRLLQEMREATDFYFIPMAQIHMDRWSKGRVTLVGDAGYCASPISGQGTSLALGGAYVLADELGKARGDDRTAFARYEERMRPFVTLNQNLVSQEVPPLERIIEITNSLSLDG